MTTTPFEDAIADAVAGVESYIADGWPLIVAGVLGLLGFRWFKRIAR